MSLPKFLTNFFKKPEPSIQENSKKKYQIQPGMKVKKVEALQFKPAPDEVYELEPMVEDKAIPLEPQEITHVRGQKLNEEQQIHLIHLIAQGLTATQVADKFKREVGVEISFTLIYQYKRTKKWKAKIRELKAYYRDHLEEIDGASPATRINRMEYVFDRAIEAGDLRVAVQANDQTRKEFEKNGGDTLNVFMNNPTYHQLNVLSNEELIKRHKEATAKLNMRKDS